MKLLIYAYRDWSFKNIEPVLKYFDYERWWLEKGREPEWNDFDLILTCEPHIEGWRKIYPSIRDKHKILALQQGLYWSDQVNPKAVWLFDKFLLWGEQLQGVCLRHGVSENRLIVTGNPRFDRFFGIEVEDQGYTLILGGGGERESDYMKYIDAPSLFIHHPNMQNYALHPNTEELIRCAGRVLFRDTGAGILAMIMRKPVKILKTRGEMKYVKCPMYNRNEYGVNYEGFVHWAVGGPGATERVREVIEREAMI